MFADEQHLFPSQNAETLDTFVCKKLLTNLCLLSLPCGCDGTTQEKTLFVVMAKTASFLALLVVACLAHVASSFQLPASRLHAVAVSRSISTRRGARTMVMADKGYWEGEWVCADCGYIYDKDKFNGVYFEDQKLGFKCPQCSGPRRRFAKKVGDKIGITRDGGDAPIVLFSIIGGLAVIAFGIYAATSF